MTRQRFGQAYQNGRTGTVHLLVSRGFAEAEAQEAVQAAWALAWERRGQLRDRSKVLSWVASIAFNVVRERIRYRSRHVPEPPEFVTGIEPRLIASLDVEKLLSLVSGKDAESLVLRYLHGWSMHEIARAHRCSPNAVRVRLHRVRKRLRERFRKETVSSQKRKSRHPADQQYS